MIVLYVGRFWVVIVRLRVYGLTTGDYRKISQTFGTCRAVCNFGLLHAQNYVMDSDIDWAMELNYTRHGSTGIYT